MVNIDTKLKIRREETGLTQVAVAEKAYISTMSYQRYESGERIPNVHTAQLIAKALGTDVEKIFPMHKHYKYTQASK